MCIKVLSWNIQSFRSKKSELLTFLQNNLFHIVLLQETWLNEKVLITIPNYECFRNDRNANSRNPHGGVMICIHKSLAIKRIFSKNLQHIESIFAELAIGQRLITIGSVYNSSALTPKQSHDDLKKLFSLPGTLILGGDWNAKHTSWNNVKNNRKGSDLFKLCQEKLLDIHAPDSITLIPYRGDPSVVDFVLSKSILGISKPVTIDEGRSDHFPISFNIPFSVAMPASLKIKNYAKADWKSFRNNVAVEIGALHLVDNDSIDVRVEKLSKIIEKADKRSIPLKNPRIFRYPSSSDIKDLIVERNRVRNESKTNPRMKNTLNHLNRLIKNKTCNINVNSFNEKLSNLKISDRSIFNFARAIKRKKIPLPPMKNDLGNFVYSDGEKATLLAKAFSSAHEIPQGDTHAAQLVSNSLRIVDNLVSLVPKYDLVKLKELKNEIAWLKLRKTSGDSINNRLLKALPDNALKYIANIFNDCLQTSYFPNVWKIGKVIALPKPGKDQSIPTNSRNITLLAAGGKLLERIILNRLKSHEEEEHVFIPQQFGFRAQHSTVKQIIRITEKVSKRFNEDKSTALVMLDLAKAFDTVWHDGIIHKMLVEKYPPYLIKIIQSFLTDRQSFVAINESRSDNYLIPAGVPQGSPLSPHLFNLYINDIPIPRKCKGALFADDFALYTSIHNNSGDPNMPLLCEKLEDGLSTVKNYFENWKLKLNGSKTEAILFSKSQKIHRIKNNFLLNFEGNSIEWADTVRYLGGFLDSKLTFKNHVDTVITKAKKAVSILYCFLKKFSHVKKHIKILMYKLYIRPIFTYAAPMLANCAKTHLNKLQIFQNKCLRMVLSAPYDTRITKLHDEADTPTVKEFINKLTDKFYLSCECSSNPLIRDLGGYASDPSFKYKHKMPRKQKA